MKKFFLSVVVMLFMSTAFAQTKDNVARECVLFEIFTGVRCPYCPAAANGIAQMMEEGLAIAPVAYHTTAFSTEEYYTNETNARANYYGINSYPTLKADGVTGMSGGGTGTPRPPLRMMAPNGAPMKKKMRHDSDSVTLLMASISWARSSRFRLSE